jgi:hypothetical protein
MARVRLDQKKRKPLGYAVPDAVSSRDAWAEARILEDKSTSPLPTEPVEEPAVSDAPRRSKVEMVPCQCRCLCGNRSVNGECWFCQRGIHHRCSRMCGEIPSMSYARGMSTPFIPRRQACNGGGKLGEGKWTPKYESHTPEAVMKRATS